MGINKIQFQKCLSMAEFMENYGTEDKCHSALVTSRWPAGFVCPKCSGTHHSTFERKGLLYWQCSAIIYSLVETAKANGIEPYTWLRHVLEHLPAARTADEMEKLLPWNLHAATLQTSRLAG